VTLQLVWQEYRQTEPTGYAYSRFCELYREWAAKLDPVLRQVHGPGEKLFVDWAGQTVPIHDAASGALTAAHVFVAVLGASNKTFVEAFPNEQLASWITGHVHAYNFFGGVTKATVPDYVARHIIGLLFPAQICGLKRGKVLYPGALGPPPGT
jgi:transposase